MLQFAVWNANGDDSPKTMNRIAKALGMTPQPHVTDMLLELVNEGKITFQILEKSGRWAARGFLPVELPIITEKYGKRRIVVKHRGVEAGQLEMGI